MPWFWLLQAQRDPDWNNNYGEDPDKAVAFHCSNLPQDVFGGEATMDYQEIIAGRWKREHVRHPFGKIKQTKLTYCRVSTDDEYGRIRAYMGEAEITDDPVDTFGACVVEVPEFQKLLHYICSNGFEHT